MQETATGHTVRPSLAHASRSMLGDDAIRSDVDAEWTSVRSGPEGFVYVTGLAELPALIKQRARAVGKEITDRKAQQAAGLLLALAVLVVDRHQRLKPHQTAGELRGGVWVGGYWADIPGTTDGSIESFRQLRDLLGHLGLLDLRPATKVEGGDGRRLHGLTQLAVDEMLVPRAAPLERGTVPLQRHALRQLGGQLARHVVGVGCVLQLWRIVSLLVPAGPGLDDLGFLEAMTSQLADRWSCGNKSVRTTRDLLLEVDGVHPAPEPRTNAATPRSLGGRRQKLHDALDLVCELTGRQIRFAPARTAADQREEEAVPCHGTTPCCCATPPPNNARNATCVSNSSGAEGTSRIHDVQVAPRPDNRTPAPIMVEAAFFDDTTKSRSYTAAAIRWLEPNLAAVSRWAQTASPSVRGAAQRLQRLGATAVHHKAAVADGIIRLTDDQRRLDAAVARVLRALSLHSDDIDTSVAFADLDTALAPLELVKKIGARIREFADTAARPDPALETELKRLGEALFHKPTVTA